MNIVRTNQRTGGTHQAEGGASSWNRITVGDFHAMDRMMTVVFADQAGAIVPKPGATTDAGTGSAMPPPMPPPPMPPMVPSIQISPTPAPVRVDPTIQRANRAGSGSAAK
jgi:hypothetical protein